MPKGEVLVSSGEESEAGKEIINGLPPWMSKDNSNGNFKLLDPVGRTFDKLKDDIRDAENATTVQNAETKDQLKEKAKLVDLPPKTDEPVEKYRRRVIAEFQTATSEGTLGNIFENTSTLLDIDKEKIKYIENEENGLILLEIPSQSIDSVPITDTEFANIIDKHVAAGYRINLRLGGTLTYITPTMYNNDDHDATKGYDGLDSNGDPKDNGGTYAGLI